MASAAALRERSPGHRDRPSGGGHRKAPGGRQRPQIGCGWIGRMPAMAARGAATAVAAAEPRRADPARPTEPAGAAATGEVTAAGGAVASGLAAGVRGLRLPPDDAGRVRGVARRAGGVFRLRDLPRLDGAGAGARGARSAGANTGGSAARHRPYAGFADPVPRESRLRLVDAEGGRERSIHPDEMVYLHPERRGGAVQAT